METINKKPYPINGLEHNAIYSKNVLCYMRKSKIRKRVKKKINKRFRKAGKIMELSL